MYFASEYENVTYVGVLHPGDKLALGVGARKAEKLADLNITGESEFSFDEASHTNPPAWAADADYTPSDLVTHDGKTWFALPDVETGIPPDDVFDLTANTGGWAEWT